MRLEGKVALISGAASGIQGELMGFGGAAAKLFSLEGAKVVLTDINDELGQKTANEIGKAGGEALYFHLDVTKEEEWVKVIAETVSRFGRLDVLVNNAGSTARYTVEETTVEAWDSQMDVHAKGVFLGTKHVIPVMRKVGGGSIINVSSIYGLVGSETSTAYHAAKGASRLFTKSAAIQYAKENIRVNSVHPGFVLTPLTEKAFADPEVINPRIERVPMKRLGLVEEVANGILFLASDESSFVTGAELVIDGGFTAQ